MDATRLATILEQICKRETKDVTEDELQYCLNHALASRVTVDDHPQVGLTQKGKNKLQELLSLRPSQDAILKTEHPFTREGDFPETLS